MTVVKTESFNVIGISVRTSNDAGKAEIDIPALWNRFFTEGIREIIPNKKDERLDCIYTDYEGDYTKPYTTLLGCRVENLEDVPEGMIGKTIDGCQCQVFTASGNISDGIVLKEWIKIWNNTSLNRSYTADYEVYNNEALQMKDSHVDIYVAISK